jgi:hypothetical protein
MFQTIDVDNNSSLTSINKSQLISLSDNNDTSKASKGTNDGIDLSKNPLINNNNQQLIDNENCDNLINLNNKCLVKFNESTTVTSDGDVRVEHESLNSIIQNELISENEPLTIVLNTEIVEEDSSDNRCEITYPTEVLTTNVDSATVTITTTTATSNPSNTGDNKNCDNDSLSAADTEDNSENDGNNTKTKLKSILSGSPEKQKSDLRKKSVSFDTDEETLRKFISGDEIVDKQNPFRHPVSLSDQEDGPTYKLIKNYNYNKPLIPKLQPRSTKLVDSGSVNDKSKISVDAEEFVSTEEVLNQSKYVPTYIKNPDPVLTYDKSVLDKLTERRLAPPKKSPVPCPRKSKLPQFSDAKQNRDLLSRKNSKKQAKFSSKNTNPSVKYPDLSDLKIKTGTDLDESFYDPNEVVKNVRKFDDRFRTINLGSQDDLDEISDLTSDRIENNETELVDQTDSRSNVQTSKEIKKNEEPKKTLTNTVNSFEFREFLKRKGLSLVPLKSNGTNGLTNGSLTNGSLVNNSATSPLIAVKNTFDEIDENMDGKGEKKRSVLRRLFPSSLFSKSKTSPKESNMPQPLIITKKPLIKDLSLRETGDLKRVVLDSASFHSATSSRSSIPANNEFTKQFSLREKSNKCKTTDDDRGSSISSVLTAADYCDVNSFPSPPLAKNSLDRSEAFRRDKRTSLTSKFTMPNEQSAKKGGYVSVYSGIDSNRTRLYSSKLRAPAVTTKLGNEQPLSFKKDSPNLSEGVVKPKVQRPRIPTSSSKQLLNNVDGSSLIKPPPVPLRRSSERSSLIVYRKPDDSEIIPMMSRSISLDREMTKRKKRAPDLPIRNYFVEPQYAKQLNRNGVVSQSSTPRVVVVENVKDGQNLHNLNELFVTPTTSNEKLLEANGKSTSTPINDGLKQSRLGKSVDISPIAKATNKHDVRQKELDPYLYVKLHEMKKKADNELYIKAQQEIQFQNNSIYGRPKEVQRRGSVPTEMMTDNIYESTERMQQSYLPTKINYLNPNFVRNSPQRNTIEGIVRSGQNIDRYLQIRQQQQQQPQQPVNNPMNFQLRSEICMRQPPQPQQAIPLQCPPMRSQSVLDGMTANHPLYGVVDNRQNDIPVIMRKGGTVDKKQILKEIYEFYRRSVNSTPTKLKSIPIDDRSVPSPISYASLRSARLANDSVNTIPRAQSVTADYSSMRRRDITQQDIDMRKMINEQNMYGQGQKRVSFNQEVTTGHSRAQTFSDSDSVFLPNSPRKLTKPVIEVSHAQRISTDNPQAQKKAGKQPYYSQEFQQQIYGRIAAKSIARNQENPYGFLQERPSQNGQIYGYTRLASAVPTAAEQYLLMQQQKQQQRNLTTTQAGSLTPNRLPPQQYYDRRMAHNSRVVLDGRSTPLVLQATTQKPELVYRPIRAGQPQPVQVQQQITPQIQPRSVQQLRGLNNNRSTVIVNSQEYLGSDNVLYKLKPNGRLSNFDGANAAHISGNYHYPIYESESGSEAGEVQRILQNRQKGERNFVFLSIPIFSIMLLLYRRSCQCMKLHTVFSQSKI